MFVMALIMKCRNYHKHSWNPFIENVHMGVAWSRLLIVCYCFFFCVAEKHPVSALMEICSRRKWPSPQFVVLHESGPPHKKNFIMQVGYFSLRIFAAKNFLNYFLLQFWF